MQIKTDGIVIKQQKINDNDRYLTILTRDNGVIRAYANSVCGIKSKMCSSTSLMSYSDFVINESKGNFRVVSADLKKAFFNVGSDLSKVSLASYLLEVTSVIGVSDSSCAELLRLLLNTLHFIEQGTVDIFVLKSIFELRSLALCGFAPQVAVCCQCSEYTDEKMRFSIKTGEIVCDSCFTEYQEKSATRELTPDALKAVRFMVFAELKDVFKLKLSPQLAKYVTTITEDYCRFQLEKQFNTLNFFYSVI